MHTGGQSGAARRSTVAQHAHARWPAAQRGAGGARTVVVPVVGEDEQEAHTALGCLREHPVEGPKDALVVLPRVRLQCASPLPVTEGPHTHNVQAEALRVVLRAREGVHKNAQTPPTFASTHAHARAWKARTSRPVTSAFWSAEPKLEAVRRLYCAYISVDSVRSVRACRRAHDNSASGRVCGAPNAGSAPYARRCCQTCAEEAGAAPRAAVRQLLARAFKATTPGVAHAPQRTWFAPTTWNGAPSSTKPVPWRVTKPCALALVVAHAASRHVATIAATPSGRRASAAPELRMAAGVRHRQRGERGQDAAGAATGSRQNRGG